MGRTDQRNRRSERKTIRWTVHATGPDTVIIGADVCNISREGINLRTHSTTELPNQGDLLTLTLFTPPFHRGVTTTGIVKWVGTDPRHEQGVGIQFEDPTTIDRLYELSKTLVGNDWVPAWIKPEKPVKIAKPKVTKVKTAKPEKSAAPKKTAVKKKKAAAKKK